jgi:hypothetical protein
MSLYWEDEHIFVMSALKGLLYNNIGQRPMNKQNDAQPWKGEINHTLDLNITAARLLMFAPGDYIL